MKRLSTEQFPGVYRRNVGDIAIATVNDGLLPSAFSDIVGADPAVCETERQLCVHIRVVDTVNLIAV